MARQRTAPSRLARLFRDNLQRMMQANAEIGSQAALARASGVRQSNIQRILALEQVPGLDMVARIADAFDLEPWQMLIDDLYPSNPPITKAVDERQKLLFNRFRQAAEELAHYNAQRHGKHDKA
jgi:transcriptional regulator with XRE-family HTH domain